MRVPLAAAACAGIAAWFSIGALAVGNSAGQAARFGLLPPWWLLPLLVAAFVVIAWRARLSSRTAQPLFFALVLLLPWIPGKIPAAFLVWSGHVVPAVWVGIVTAMLAERGTAWPTWCRDPRRAPRAAAAIAVALYIGAAWNLSGILPGGDEPHYLVITQSLLKDGDLQIENNHARGDYLEYFRGQLRPDFLKRGVNGQIYSIHAPGLSAIVAPAYALFGYRGVVGFLAAVAALGGALLWKASYRLAGGAAAAWFAWAAWALTVPFFFEAFSIFPDGLGATLVLFGALPLVDASSVERRRAAEWLAVGTALALLPWVHTRFAVVAAMLGLFLVQRLVTTPEGRSRLAPFLTVPVISAAAWFGFFKLVYGTFSPTAPYGGYTQSSPAYILNGLPALLFDQQFGILPNAPVYGFCFVGMAALARRRPRLAMELTLTALAYLLSASAYFMWWGGSSAPARFAVPVLPLLVLPGAWLWSTARHPATRSMALALICASVAITATMAAVNGGQLAYNFRDGYSRFAEWLTPLVDLPQALPSFFRQTPRAAVSRAVCWAAPIWAVWLALRALERRNISSLATLTGMAVAVMASLTGVWSLGGVAGWTPETSQLDLLEHVDPRVRPHGVSFSPLALVSGDRVVTQLSIGTPTRRPAPSAPTLLLVPNVLPAGQYALEASTDAAPAGTAGLVIGRNARPIISWDLAAALHGGGVRFDLPVDVGSIVVTGDEKAAASVKTMKLRPVQLVSPRDRLAGGYARLVARYGPGLAYFFDDGVFVEEPGFWVRGAGRASIAVRPSARGKPLQLFVRNAAAVNHVEIAVDGKSEALDLQPREERMMPIAISRALGAALIEVSSRSGFRPSEVESGSADTRFLGVWIELRE